MKESEKYETDLDTDDFTVSGWKWLSAYALHNHITCFPGYTDPTNLCRNTQQYLAPYALNNNMLLFTIYSMLVSFSLGSLSPNEISLNLTPSCIKSRCSCEGHLEGVHELYLDGDLIEVKLFFCRIRKMTKVKYCNIILSFF